VTHRKSARMIRGELIELAFEHIHVEGQLVALEIAVTEHNTTRAPQIVPSMLMIPLLSAAKARAAAVARLHHRVVLAIHPVAWQAKI
jgi:hypothetical protein